MNLSNITKIQSRPVYRTVVQVYLKIFGCFVPRRGNGVIVEVAPTSSTDFTLIDRTDKVTSRSSLPLFTHSPQHSINGDVTVPKFHPHPTKFEPPCVKQQKYLKKEKPQGQHRDCPIAKV